MTLTDKFDFESDEIVQNWVRRRDDLRREKRFEESDRMREVLYSHGIVVTDEEANFFPSPGKRWMRVDTRQKYSLYRITETGCLVWSHRRRSFCRRQRAEGSWFCEHHAKNGLHGRVPCPFDCRHHIKMSTVGSHVLVCEKSPGVPQLSVVGKSGKVAFGTLSRVRRDEEMEREANICCKNIDVVRSLKRKLEAALQLLRGKELMNREAKDIDCETTLEITMTKRKLPRRRTRTSDIQCESIAEHLCRRLNETKKGTNVARVALVEFCAGKGRLSEIVSRHLLNSNVATALDVVLLDRCRSRCKRDIHITADSVRRLVLDIANVDIVELKEVRRATCSESGVVCAVGKHCCGTAADLAVRSCIEIAKSGSKICCAFALCCHHLCEWSAVSCRDVLEAVDIDAFDFLMMRKLSIRALAPTEIGHVGRLVKRLINKLRARALVKSGLFCGVRIMEYCDPSVSPENQLLIAHACVA